MRPRRSLTSGPKYRPAAPRSTPLPSGGVVLSGGIRSYRDLYALTVWQPWAWAIAAGLKLVENRTWRPLPLQPGDTLAIHAAAKEPEFDDLAMVRHLAAQAGVVMLDTAKLVRGALVAVVTLDRVVSAVAELPREQRLWWTGPLGWVLRDVRVLPRPLGAKGQQGLWPIGGELVHQVWDQLEPRESA